MPKTSLVDSYAKKKKINTPKISRLEGKYCSVDVEEGDMKSFSELLCQPEVRIVTYEEQPKGNLVM